MDNQEVNAPKLFLTLLILGMASLGVFGLAARFEIHALAIAGLAIAWLCGVSAFVCCFVILFQKDTQKENGK